MGLSDEGIAMTRLDLESASEGPMTEKRSLAAKLAAIAHSCAYVQKDKQNDFHRYRYASAAAVLEKVNGALAEHRVAVTVHPTIESVVEAKNHKGNIERLVTVRVLLKLHDGDSGEAFETSGLGSGQDGGDKAVMKAQTAALKYAWMLALSVSTGDDPEDDPRTDEAAARGPRGERPARTRQELSKSLARFASDLEAVELPGEAVLVWQKHRGELASLEPALREQAWRLLCERTSGLGLKNARVWLKREIAYKDARQQTEALAAQESS